MIIYKSSSAHFDFDIRYNKITDKLESEFYKITGRRVAQAEKRSWQNSLSKINEVLLNERLNEKDCGVLIEYQLPQSSMRLDFMITGRDKFLNKNAVIVELKQWEKAECTDTERQVITYTGGGLREVNHPAVQAVQYRQYLMDFHSSFHPDDKKAISLYTCAYLHNYSTEKEDVLLNRKFQKYLEISPLYIKRDTKKIGTYIRNHVEQGQGLEILDYIDYGIPKPSKKLINYVNQILDANSEFILMENQMVIFDRVMQLVRDKKLDGTDGKYVVLVKGGPGTGKSVVGLNLLGKILKEEKECTYLASNAAFKNGMANKIDKVRAKKLFKHPYYYNKDLVLNNEYFQTAIIDEAHRISETPPPMQKKLDKSLIEAIIERTHLSVFFSDDLQMIRPKDIGAYSHIKEVAKKMNCHIYEYELNAQFRCAGSDGYINWLDDVLGIRQTANASGWENIDNLEFYIFDSPAEMRKRVIELQNAGYNSRIVAGYAWPWSKDLDENGYLVNDVKIYEGGQIKFEMPWNPKERYSTRKQKGIPKGSEWAIDPNGVYQVGCIHTCQGLEFDYVGVIIGEEFTFNSVTQNWEADSAKCYDTKIGNKYEDFLRLAQNTYKTLLTRGTKGVFVYAVDKDTQKYLKTRLKIVKDMDHLRFYHKKDISIESLFTGENNIAAETDGNYEIGKTIKIKQYNIKPMVDKYYYCDIVEQQMVYEELKSVLSNTDIEINKELKTFFEDSAQIRYYAEGKTGLIIDTEIVMFKPIAIVNRLVDEKEVISFVFILGS